MKRLVFWLLALVLILATIDGAVAATYYDVPTQTMGSSGSFAQCIYVRYNGTEPLTVFGFTKHGSTTATRGFFYNGSAAPDNPGNCATGNASYIASCTFSGNNCYLDTNITTNVGQNWTFAIDNAGAAWNQNYGTAGQLPAYGNTSKIRWQGAGSNGGGPYYLDGTPRSITGIYFTVADAPAGPNVITVNLSNLVNGSSWPSSITFANLTGNLSFAYFNITGTGYCVTVTGNGTSTNCTTTGSGASTHFNVSNNSVIVTGTQTVSAGTYQAIINVSAYRLFLNTSISTYNTTNGVFTNTSGAIVYALNGSNNVKVDVAGNYSVNVSCTVSAPLTTIACNATGIYDDLFTIGAKYAGSGISSFNVTVTNDTLGGTLTTVSTSTGNATIPLLQGYWYYFLINASGYALGNTTIPANASTNLYNFTLYRAQSIQLLIKDEITRDLLNATFTLELINDQEANNYTTSNGTFYIDLVIPEDYTFRYRATDYPERDYYSTIATQSTNNITLYAISFNESDDVLVTVTSTSGFPIEDATVKLLRYYVYCNCYEVVEMAKTSYAGVAFFNAQYYEGHYKWSVDYQGTNYFISETPEVLVPEEGEITVTRTIVINLGTDYYSQYVDLTDTGYACTYNATSGGLSFTWSDTTGLVTQGCLDAQVLNGVNYESIGVNCQSAGTGGVVQNTNTSRTYKYEAYLVVDGETTSVCAGILNEDPGYDFGNAGMFLAMGIIITLVLAFSYSAIGVLVITAVGIIIVNMLGLMTFTGSFISGFAVLVIGLAVYVMRS